MIKDTYKNAFLNTGKAFKQLLFYKPRLCELCRADGDIICRECVDNMPMHQNILCDKCGRQIKIKGLCNNCTKHHRPYEKGIIIFFYQDIPKQMMYEFKFNGKREYAKVFACEIHNKIILKNWDIDIITPIPMHALKLFGRGYNPPALIAKRLSKLMDVSYNKKLLKRTRYTKAMALLGRIDRMKHVSKNFKVYQNDLSNKTILVVDDVSTTGATLHICSKLLMDAGAEKVFAAAACGDNNSISTSTTLKGRV